MRTVPVLTTSTESVSNIGIPSAWDQYMLELVNRARDNPDAEAARYGIDLNEGLLPGTISNTSKQPLAFNPHLLYSAQNYSKFLLNNNLLGHTADGKEPGDRMADAGYGTLGEFGWTENLAAYMSVRTQNMTNITAYLHKQLFTDFADSVRGHRKSILWEPLKEIGIGVIYGSFTLSEIEYDDTIMITQDFAYKLDDNFLTGVVFNDTLVKDFFYTPGEGIGGVTVTAVRKSDAAEFFTTTWNSGGYSLQLPPGSYDVTASSAFLGTISYENLIIGDENVKLDFPVIYINLTQGWNLISIPLVLDDDSVDEVFQSIDYDYLFSYDSGYKIPATVNRTRGYWINVNSPSVLSVKGADDRKGEFDLKKGWNLIGFPRMNSLNVSKFPASPVLSYNGTWSCCNSIDRLYRLYEMKPGYGYWVWSD